MSRIRKALVSLCGLCVVLAVIKLFITQENYKSWNETEITGNIARYAWNRVGVDIADEEDEERRLKESPYIYHPEEDNTRLLPEPSQPVAKLVSWYLPWEIKYHKSHENSFKECNYNKCQWVTNMSQADAVLFTATSILRHVIPNFYRPKGQRWILFTRDPSSEDYGLGRSDVKSNFNWTVTYQLDSDIPNIFGILGKRDLPDRDFEAIFDKKDRDVAWFVSHCSTSSLREKYAERMRTIINVDIFGLCGNMTCGPIRFRDNDSTECLPMLTNRYKFYLSFENSFCKYYVSEKLFKLFRDVDIIPVVRGGFDYKKYLPSGIFVDSSHYKTPEDLARHLVWLGQNKAEYVAMLKRKSQWKRSKGSSIYCRLCEALHTAPPKYYPDLKARFSGDQSECWAPPDLGPSNIY